MNFARILIISWMMIGVCGCAIEDEANRKLRITEIPTPSQRGGEPNLFLSETGKLYLSWIEYLNDTTDALYFSQLLDESGWSAPQLIASGSDWFVNWADFPSLAGYKDDGKTLVAHWLQKSDEGTFDYDVRIAQSNDYGKSWKPSFIVHQDGIPAEHGFVSLVPMSAGRMFATWLDGRNTKGGHGQNHSHGHQGAMTLRAAVFNGEANLYDEVELDNRVCDCCQTAAIMTDCGLVVAYRDRYEDEIRDISIVRHVNGQWTPPKPVFEDNWMIAGCPVNGPALAVNGSEVAIAWFTMNGPTPAVKLAFSTDCGEHFNEPIIIAEDKTLGRIDLIMKNSQEAWVSWMEDTEQGASIKLSIVKKQGKEIEHHTVMQTKASRNSGFPKMEIHRSEIYLAWTHVDSITQVRTARIGFD